MQIYIKVNKLVNRHINNRRLLINLSIKLFSNYTDVVIIGYGIYGGLISKELAQNGIKSIILEKESYKSLNNSKGNSGVFHSGVYNKPNSLKKYYCQKGNIELQEYCNINNICYNMSGKLIVPNNNNQLKKVLSLYDNYKNYKEVEEFDNYCKLLTLKEANEYANVITNLGKDNKDLKHILYIKNAGYTNPKQVFKSIDREISNINNNKIAIKYKEEVVSLLYCSIDNRIIIKTNKNNIYNCKYLINCGGNNSLKIANEYYNSNNFEDISVFNESEPINNLQDIYIPANYMLYKKMCNFNNNNNNNVYNNDILIYQSPSNFSLGVHTTPSLENKYSNIKKYFIGPTVDFNKSTFELIYNILVKLKMSKNNTNLIKQYFVDAINSNKYIGVYKLSKIINDIKIFDYNLYKTLKTKQLIRAPLLNTNKCIFEKDFIIKTDNINKSIHLLNIQSPGFTSAFSLSKDISMHVIKKIN